MSFLRNAFGQSRGEIWDQLSSEIGGRKIDGGFWKGDKIEASHGQWTITLDTYTHMMQTGKSTIPIMHTRMRAPFVNKDGFRFTIARRGLFSGLGKFFGVQDVEVGYESFDRDFVIKGTDEQKLEALFASKRLRELLTAQPQVYFSVLDDEGYFGQTFPDGVDELRFDVAAGINDVERLKQLYELFAETLDQLCRIGSAYESEPDVKL